jgi:Tol biopolymer transport system component
VAVVTPEPVGQPADCQGRLAFAGRINNERNILMVNADGSGLVSVTNGGGSDGSPAWSPDGERIAFERHEGNRDLYIVSADGGELLRLTDLPSTEFDPTWSPDGDQLVFASQSGYSTGLYAVSAQGGEAYPLTDSGAHKLELAWSPGGSLLAYTMYDGYNQGDIWLIAAPDFRGTGPENLTQNPAHDCCAGWSPDGEWLLFLSSRNHEGAGSMLPPSGSLLAQARQDQASDTRSHAVKAVTTVMPEAPEAIYLVRSDGSQLVKLPTGPGRVRYASWSPVGAAGGERIALVSDLDGRSDLYVVGVQDGEAGSLTRLTDNSEDKGWPVWSPDGTCLAFQQYSGNVVELYVMSTDGTGLSKLAENLVWGGGMSWAP